MDGVASLKFEIFSLDSETGGVSSVVILPALVGQYHPSLVMIGSAFNSVSGRAATINGTIGPDNDSIFGP